MQDEETFPKISSYSTHFSPVLQHSSQKAGSIFPQLTFSRFTPMIKRKISHFYIYNSRFISNEEQVSLKHLKDMISLPKLYSNAPCAAACDILDILSCLKTATVAKDSWNTKLQSSRQKVGWKHWNPSVLSNWKANHSTACFRKYFTAFLSTQHNESTIPHTHS